jgi:hypothetical protein
LADGSFNSVVNSGKFARAPLSPACFSENINRGQTFFFPFLDDFQQATASAAISEVLLKESFSIKQLPPAFYSIAYRLSIDVFRNMVR